jgi:threonine/homoserine/homoserine lactone efflux protein
MVAFYSALGIFVATSVAIAVIAAVARDLTWVAVILGVLGALFMLYGSVLLVIESRMAMASIASEMDFVWKISKRYAGDRLEEARGGPATWLGKKIG